MANILGSLQVELTANTAKFVGELGKAAVLAQQSAKNISREFSSLQRVASQTFSAFGSFAPQVSQLSFALSSISSAASSAMKEFGSTKTALGAIASISAGTVAALGAVALGTVGAAMHAAESAAKLDELSQSTGVSTKALSGLGFVAKQFGIDSEQMIRGLERMDKSALAAATSQAGAINAYTRLGVSVRDAGGQIRSTEGIFSDIAEKFASMPDGVTKTALAIEIFGRSGAALIPALDAGKAGIQEMLQQAQKLGLVISGETAEAAEKFEQTLGRLEARFTGISNKLLTELLPIFERIATALDNLDLSKLDGFITKLADLVKAFLEVANVAFLAGREVYDFFSVAVMPHDVLDHLKDMKTALQDFASFSRMLYEPPSGPKPFDIDEAVRHRLGIVDTSPKKKGLGAAMGEKDIVGEAIGKLQAEAAAQLALAGAIDRSTAAMLFQKAAGEAEKKVSDLRVGLLAQEKTLREELANARANPTAAEGDESAKIEARIAGVHKELAALDAAAPLFTKLYAQIAAAKASSSASGELQKKSDDFDRQITSLKEISASFAKGPAAVASAEIDKQLEAEKEKIDDLREEYARLASIPGVGIIAPEQGQGPSPALAEMSAAIDAAVAKFEELKTKAAAIRGLEIDSEIAKLGAGIRGAAPLLAELNHAYLENETAVRKARVALELYHWTQAHPGATPDQVRAQGEALATESEQAHASAIAQEAEQYSLIAAYTNRIQKLEQIRELIQSEGASTLLVDAAIYDEQRKQLEQWDQAAIKVGTFGEQMHAVLNQVALDAENAGGKIAESMNKAIGGVEDNIAKLIVTGKANFKSLFEGLAESMIKIQLQSAAGSIEKAIGIKIPGLEGKRGDSAGNPLYVQDVSRGAGNLPLGPGFGSGRSLPSILNLGKPTTGTTPPFVGESSAAPGSAPPTFIARLLSSFGIKMPTAAGSGTNTKPLGSSGDPIYVLTAPAGETISGAKPGSSYSLGDQGIFDETSSMHLRPSSILENLPLGPGFGSGRPLTTLEALPGITPPFATGEIASSGGPGMIGSIASSLGLNIPGMSGGKTPAGTSSSPVFVSIVGKAAGAASGGVTSLLGDLMGKGGEGESSGQTGNLPLGPGFGSGILSTTLSSLLSPETDTSAGGGGLLSLLGIGGEGGGGGLLSGLTSIGKIFSSIPFLAAGGPANHGHAYVVGEKGPELFVPGISGTIIPTFSTMKPPREGEQLGNMGRAFGGFRAAGGDVMPGRAYAVGEKHPEVFMPDTARGSAPSSSGAGGTREINFHQHIYGVQDHDSFRRSQSQIYAGIHAQISLAQDRG
jgi:Lambda phage tail tape-measure protein (Tape_meas_lam_C)